MSNRIRRFSESHMGCFALTLIAAALLAGCGGSQPISAPGAMPLSQAAATHAERSGLRMLPGAKSHTLVYTAGGCGGMCVLTYPEGKLKDRISLTYPVAGVCSDSAGDVFVMNGAQVLEYAHGGTTPIATLAVPGDDTGGCGADSRTGNLAVTLGGNSAGNIAIYQNATGSPTVYDAGEGAAYCGYDKNGDLFVSGYINGQNAFAELPYGSSSFISLTLNGETGPPGQVQWDGRYITWESGAGRGDTKISRLSVSGSTASVIGKTELRSPKWIRQSWIAGNRVIVPFSSQGSIVNKIGIWRYPKSGKIVEQLGTFDLFTQFQGVTLSVAPSSK